MLFRILTKSKLVQVIAIRQQAFAWTNVVDWPKSWTDYFVAEEQGVTGGLVAFFVHVFHFLIEWVRWCNSIAYAQGFLLLMWINFNLNIDKQSYAQYSVGWNYLIIPNCWSLGIDK